MRNKNRIEPFLKAVQTLWEKQPDLRFGQIIYMLAENLDSIPRDIFFPEEDEWLRAISKTKTAFK